MNRSFWTALILTAVACAIVMVTLAFNNKRLSDRLAAGSQAADPVSREQASQPGSESNRTLTPALSSEEKVERASGKLARFLASLEPPDGSELEPLTFLDTEGNREGAAKRIAFWENLPDLLRAVEGLSVDELLAVMRNGVVQVVTPWSHRHSERFQLLVGQPDAQAFNDCDVVLKA